MTNAVRNALQGNLGGATLTSYQTAFGALQADDVRGSAIFQTFTGGLQNEQILFTANPVPLIISGSPTFTYFATLVSVGPTPQSFLVQNLNLTTTTSFSLRLPGDGDYRLGLGVLRNNPGNLFSAYGTSGAFSGVTGAGVPEIDPGSAAAPLAFALGSLLLLHDRRRHGSPVKPARA